MEPAIGDHGAELAWQVVPAQVVRARIALAFRVATAIPAPLGAIELRPHQHEGVAQLTRVIRTFGGALLADDVGMGKTFTALAAAREASAIVVVAPAALRPMWRDAIARTGLSATIVSYEQLSAGRATLPGTDFVIADEAHHARNPRTRRYAALAQLTRGAVVLLLTATPLHNGERDLRHLLALFLGERARHGDDSLLRACTVRRVPRHLAGDARLPAISRLEWIPLPHNEDLVHALTAIPAPVPPRDGGTADALLAILLLRLWCSSDWALRAALRRLLSRSTALTAALQDGRYPLRDELAAWRLDQDGLQLAFAPLVAPAMSSPGKTRELLGRLDAHAAAVRHAARVLADGPSTDAARQAYLERLIGAAGTGGIVAFTQFEDTARGLFRLLRQHTGVVVLSARGGQAATGRLSRDAVLRLARPAPERHRDPLLPLRLLIATDLLSEGVNLGQLQHVVHLDLPWTPARAHQRVGRLRRPESIHHRIDVCAFELPLAAERLAGILRTLQRKARTSGRLIATRELLGGAPWDGGDEGSPAAQLDADAELRQRLRDWCGDEPNADAPRDLPPCIAVVRADAATEQRVLVLATVGDLPRLVVLAESGAEESPGGVASLLNTFEGDDSNDLAVLPRAMAALRAWLSSRRAELIAVGGCGEPPNVHRKALRALARLEQTLPRAERLRAIDRLARLRDALVVTRGAGAERRLSEALGVLQATNRGDVAGALEAAIGGDDANAAPVPRDPTLVCAIVASP